MRCAVYIRVSTDKEEQKSSLENQRSLFYQYLEDKGWDVFDFYVDVESGTTDKRENLQRLIQDAKERKFDTILAKELSRFTNYLFCADCGKALWYVHYRKGYVCGNYYNLCRRRTALTG